MRIGLLVCALLATLLSTRSARAHDPFELTATIDVRLDAVVVATTMARATALRLTGGERSARATFPPEAFGEHRARLEAIAPALFALRSAAGPLPAKTAAASLTDEGDVELVVSYGPHSGGPLTLHAEHLAALSEGYTSALRVKSDESVWFKLLTATDSDFTLELTRPGGNVGPAPLGGNGESAHARFGRFVGLGVEHVLTGYDHLLFLLGVLVACRSVRGMLWLVSCFTLAHSVTLALATLGQVSAPTGVVEPLIAASIVFVGVENLGTKPPLVRRIGVTFAFGLIHGLGFAAVLRELDVPRDALASTLVAFNVGVELGQLGVAVIALPLLLRLHESARGTRGLRYASVVLSAVGCFWLGERLLAA